KVARSPPVGFTAEVCCAEAKSTGGRWSQVQPQDLVGVQGYHCLRFAAGIKEFDLVRIPLAIAVNNRPRVTGREVLAGQVHQEGYHVMLARARRRHRFYST